MSLVRQAEMKSQIILEKHERLGLTVSQTHSTKPKSGRGRKRKDLAFMGESIELHDLREPVRHKTAFQYFAAGEYTICDVL